ncbi:MBL fold metallo-hydrolase [Phytoactinopolyspora limicola]|uniref:MBL fold metallo-hydrolase n=1 Tax=Phytoactinopolyspora limicola TaxID=2715536 RepID=UPI0014075945|nr:MBL fold metallo-hydrolase [Phytoactinopolyspora limicola]
MVQLILLGTGTPMPDPTRCGSGTAVTRGGAWVLVDCGRGVTQRALQAGLDLPSLHAVLITHHHSDHVSDLATLAITRWVAGAPNPLTVVAANGPSARYATSCLDSFEDQAFHAQVGPSSPKRPAITVNTFRADSSPEVVWHDAGWLVSAALVDHHPIEAAVGYRIEADGRSVVVSGDTAVCDGIAGLAAGTDVLVHEALRSDLVPARSLEWNASAGSVGELAHELSLNDVILTHLLPAPHSVADEQAFVDEARASGYRGRLVIAHDLMVYGITRG